MEQTAERQKINPYKRTLKQILSVKLMPQYIIIGAQKSGTGSLFEYLAEHPNVVRARRKEVNFFDVNFHRGLGWYRGQFPMLADEYYRRRLRGLPTITGEASPNYMIHPLAPRRIRQVLPDVKLIALLRNPVERAYSQYQHNLRDKSEPLSFEEALKAEPERLAGLKERLLADDCADGYNSLKGVAPGGQLEATPTHGDFLRYCKGSYHLRGVYVDLLKMWTDVFPKQQLLVLEFERLCKEPADVFRETQEFLGLPPWEPESYGKSNYFGRYADLKPETRSELEAYFAPHNERLYEFLGRRFDW
jgi:hypothetical protein